MIDRDIESEARNRDLDQIRFMRPSTNSSTKKEA
jgi:hypothetical protein